MASTYSPLLRLELIGAGDQAGLWGNTTNNNLGSLLEQAIAGVASISLSSTSDYTLSNLNGAPDEARAAVLVFSGGSGTGAINIIIPATTKLYVVRNNTTNVLHVKTSGGSTYAEVLAGDATMVYCDGAEAYLGIVSANVGTLSVSGGGTGKTTFTAGFVKSPGGTTALTTASTVNASTELSGAVPVANGGTGLTSFTPNAIFLANGGGTAISGLVGSATGQVATWNGSNWTAATPSAGGVTAAGNNTFTGTNTFNYYTTFNYTLSAGSGCTTTLAGSNYITGSTSMSGYTTHTNYNSFGTAVPPTGGSLYSQTATYFCGPSSGAIGAYFDQGALTNTALGPVGVNINVASGMRNSIFFTNGIGNGVGAIQNDGSNITIVNFSDYRLKQDVTPLVNAADRVKKLNPVAYKLIKNSGVPCEGFLAHELQEAVPLAVNGVKDEVDADGNPKYQSVAVMGIIPTLAAALKEALLRIEELEKRLGV